MSLLRRALVVLAAAAVALPAASPVATAQDPGSLPTPPPGAVGPVLDPLEDLVAEISGPLGDGLGDIPFDNAIRLTGEDAVDAAVALSQITFESSDVVLLGRDDVFADTLSSVAGQGLIGAPLLLTQTEGMDERTQAEIDRLGATRIIILGSTEAISPALEAQLAAAYDTTRIGGPSRIETAALLARELAPTADHIVLLRAYNDAGEDQSQAYADALSTGPLASSLEFPSLLTTTDALHPEVEAFIADAGVSTVTIVGGEQAISTAVEAELSALGVTVERIAGATRYETSIEIARYLGIADASEANRLILSEAGRVSDPLWAPGFAAAAQGAIFESPVILADGPLLPPETLAFLGDGLTSNALRLNNLPLICNTFVDFLACETAALLLVGSLDEANAATGGAVEQALGPAFGPAAEALDELIPGPGESSPGLVGGILAAVGVPGDPEDPEADRCSDGIDNDGDGPIDEADECEGQSGTSPDAQLEQALAGQPAPVAAAVTRMVGPEGDRVSTSRQAVLIDRLAELRLAVGGPVDTTDPVAADALVAVLDGISALVAADGDVVPFGVLAGLLDGLATLGVADLAAASALVDGLGVDAAPQVADLTGDTADLIGAGQLFASGGDLVLRHGPQAQPVAEAVDRLNRGA